MTCGDIHIIYNTYNIIRYNIIYIMIYVRMNNCLKSFIIILDLTAIISHFISKTILSEANYCSLLKLMNMIKYC